MNQPYLKQSLNIQQAAQNKQAVAETLTKKPAESQEVPNIWIDAKEAEYNPQGHPFVSFINPEKNLIKDFSFDYDKLKQVSFAAFKEVIKNSDNPARDYIEFFVYMPESKAST